MRTALPTATAIVAVLALALASVGFDPVASPAADHLDAPDLTSPGGNLMADINDLFVFHAPGKPNQVVLAATFNPAAGIFGPQGFDPNITYAFHVTTDGDAGQDFQYRVSFGPANADGSQRYFVRGGTFPDAMEPLTEGMTGVPTRIDASGVRVFAGLVDDPFFFDLDAFLGSGGRGFCDGMENDFFAGLNANAIVLQVPVELLGGPIGLWVSTDDSGEQIDRMGFPAINTVFIPKNRKNAFNRARPGGDEEAFFRFLRRTFKASGNDTATSIALADALLPDILPFDPSQPSGFLNGRTPADDVIDAELGLLTAGALTGDCVDANDVEFPESFPYFAPAHQ